MPTYVPINGELSEFTINQEFAERYDHFMRWLAEKSMREINRVLMFYGSTIVQFAVTLTEMHMVVEMIGPHDSLIWKRNAEGIKLDATPGCAATFNALYSEWLATLSE